MFIQRRPKQIQAQLPGRPKGEGPKQNQQNVPQIKQIPIKQLPIKQRPNVIREDQIRDDWIIGNQAKQIINQPKIPIPRQIPIPVIEPQVDRGALEINVQEEICSICLTAFDIKNLDGVPDELWRNVVPENILRPDVIALQRYREIQVNNNRIAQQIVIEEEEFDQQDVLDCPICHISLHQVIGKQPPPLQNEDGNVDPQDFTRCFICNTPLREAMNSNPEIVRLCNNNRRHMAHMHCVTRWYDRDGIDTCCVICGLNLILPYVRVNRNRVLQYDRKRQNRRLNIERRGKERMVLAAQRRQKRIAVKQRDLHNISQLDRDKEVDNQLDAQQINLDNNQNMWQGRLRVVDMFENMIRRVIN
ncbi:28076_t:CDS:2 [Dentiscutata erythropus]|uniref:28076_t:CDS:1 n=1 Tax=Dentiscutata erythropus TaxID=1348616 RepID=A0A9N9JK03_9GLOM|nr:28076_t:CDS:2 [Dentiscutata erythropus]